jgi:hypothetical protein
MSLPDFLLFTPVPVRARHDGWTPERQRRFILAMARGAGPGEAARSVGLSRQTAHALRRKAGSESFAAAWDAAAAFADEARGAGRAQALGGFGLETIMMPRFYRGRLIGFVAREDHRRAMRILRTLDRLAERLDPARADEVRAAGEALAEAAEADAICPPTVQHRQHPAPPAAAARASDVYRILRPRR